jgi:hypothetical protein
VGWGLIDCISPTGARLTRASLCCRPLVHVPLFATELTIFYPAPAFVVATPSIHDYGMRHWLAGRLSGRLLLPIFVAATPAPVATSSACKHTCTGAHVRPCKGPTRTPHRLEYTGAGARVEVVLGGHLGRWVKLARVCVRS